MTERLLLSIMRVLEEFVIPRREGRAFKVRQGQVLRVTGLEGQQVADTTCFDLPNLKERLSAPVTQSLARAVADLSRSIPRLPTET